MKFRVVIAAGVTAAIIVLAPTLMSALSPASAASKSPKQCSQDPDAWHVTDAQSVKNIALVNPTQTRISVVNLSDSAQDVRATFWDTDGIATGIPTTKNIAPMGQVGFSSDELLGVDPAGADYAFHGHISLEPASGDTCSIAPTADLRLAEGLYVHVDVR